MPGLLIMRPGILHRMILFEREHGSVLFTLAIARFIYSAYFVRLSGSVYRSSHSDSCRGNCR